MTCPVCSKPMKTADFGGVHVDVCGACKGMWFDWAELPKLDERHEGAGKVLQDALAYPRTNDARRERLKCPKCGLLMHAHKYDAIEQVNVDECYACRGLFVDSGELQDIRGHKVSPAEENAYLETLLKENPAVQAGIKGLEAQTAQRDAALRAWTRFLRLSYWASRK